MKVDGVWRYLYRALDQSGEAIDVYVCRRRDREAARRFFQRALTVATEPVEVTTDRAAVYSTPARRAPSPPPAHVTDRYANSRVEADHGRLKARLGPMRGLKRDRSPPYVARRARVPSERAARPL